MPCSPHCLNRKCLECRYLRAHSAWENRPWSFIDARKPALGSWITTHHAAGFALGCAVCAKAAQRSHHIPVAILKWSCGQISNHSAAQPSHLRKHAASTFHTQSVALYFGDANGNHPLAPPICKFEAVLQHVAKHNAAAHSELPDVGKSKKMVKFVLCLGEACKRLDHMFFKDVRSVSLARDARKGRLSIRFVAVNKSLECRAGVLGVGLDFGSGGEAIAIATDDMMIAFSTRYYGTRHAVLIKPLLALLRDKVHMIAPSICGSRSKSQ